MDLPGSFGVSSAIVETHYWWSNPAHCSFATGGTATCTITVPLTGNNWSDFFGHFGNDPAYAAGFASALQHVNVIGLSFGSGFFFANGVGIDGTTGTAYSN